MATRSATREAALAKLRRYFKTWREPAQPMFTCSLEPDKLDGGWVAECLELPGIMSQGETEAEALNNLVDAITEALNAKMMSQLDHLPEPTPGQPQRLKIAVG